MENCHELFMRAKAQGITIKHRLGEKSIKLKLLRNMKENLNFRARQ